MKRSWYGFGMLLVLLAAGIFTTWYMQRCYAPVERQLEEAATAAEAGDWPRAEQRLAEAQGEWQHRWGVSAALTDHAPMEQVNVLLAQLWAYARVRDPVGFRAVCAHLGEALHAIGEAHSVAWWNLA